MYHLCKEVKNSQKKIRETPFSEVSDIAIKWALSGIRKGNFDFASISLRMRRSRREFPIEDDILLAGVEAVCLYLSLQYQSALELFKEMETVEKYQNFSLYWQAWIYSTCQHWKVRSKRSLDKIDLTGNMYYLDELDASDRLYAERFQSEVRCAASLMKRDYGAAQKVIHDFMQTYPYYGEHVCERHIMRCVEEKMPLKFFSREISSFANRWSTILRLEAKYGFF